MVKIIFINFLIALASATISYPQKNNPDLILNKVIDAFKKVEDYEVDVKIKVDVDFLKAPDTEAKIYFKQPDKIHFESETFAMLPREGFDFSPNDFLKRKHTAIYEREDTIENIKTAVIKVIPLGETEDVILSTLWIDQKNNVIRKVESTTKYNGTFSIELKYEHKNLNYPLPSSMIFSFNIDKLNIPRTISGDLGTEDKTKKKDSKPNTTGKVYITYYNYKVNVGIPDSFFEKKKK